MGWVGGRSTSAMSCRPPAHGFMSRQAGRQARRQQLVGAIKGPGGAGRRRSTSRMCPACQPPAALPARQAPPVSAAAHLSRLVGEQGVLCRLLALRARLELGEVAVVVALRAGGASPPPPQ